MPCQLLDRARISALDRQVRTEGVAQNPALYALFLGEDDRLTLAAPMATKVDLTQVFGTRGGMQNRMTLPLNRLAEVLAFVEGQG